MRRITHLNVGTWRTCDASCIRVAMTWLNRARQLPHPGGGLSKCMKPQSKRTETPKKNAFCCSPPLVRTTCFKDPLWPLQCKWEGKKGLSWCHESDLFFLVPRYPSSWRHSHRWLGVLPAVTVCRCGGVDGGSSVLTESNTNTDRILSKGKSVFVWSWMCRHSLRVITRTCIPWIYHVCFSMSRTDFCSSDITNRYPRYPLDIIFDTEIHWNALVIFIPVNQTPVIAQ